MNLSAADFLMADAHRQHRERTAAIETACEAAIQGGQYGVRVDGKGVAAVDPSVPYGQLWYDSTIEIVVRAW